MIQSDSVFSLENNHSLDIVDSQAINHLNNQRQNTITTYNILEKELRDRRDSFLSQHELEYENFQKTRLRPFTIPKTPEYITSHNNKLLPRREDLKEEDSDDNGVYGSVSKLVDNPDPEDPLIPTFIDGKIVHVKGSKIVVVKGVNKYLLSNDVLNYPKYVDISHEV